MKKKKRMNNIPVNMTEDDVVKTISTVVSQIARKHVFPHYDYEDILQEGFIIGIAVMEKYDGKRPLENFLRVHIPRRLLNLKRDKYYRMNCEIQQRKKNLLDAAPVEDMRNLLITSELTDDVEMRELLEYIDNHLPFDLRRNYLRFRADLPLGRGKKLELFNILKEIVGKFYGEAGDE